MKKIILLLNVSKYCFEFVLKNINAQLMFCFFFHVTISCVSAWQTISGISRFCMRCASCYLPLKQQNPRYVKCHFVNTNIAVLSKQAIPPTILRQLFIRMLPENAAGYSIVFLKTPNPFLICLQKYSNNMMKRTAMVD